MNSLVKGIIVLSAVTGMALMASPTANATDNQTACVDGTVRSNLAVTWKNSGSVTVGKVSNKPLCNDTTLYFSSYVMPDNYNGKGFDNNPTATPQSVFNSTSVVMKKGATTPVAMTVTLPEACKNMQVDVYYGPEITTVYKEGHGSQYISGKMLVKTEKECAPTTPETPVVSAPPVEAQTLPTPAPEVTITPPVAVELPRTGLGVNALIAGSALSVATYGAVYLSSKRR